MTYTLIREKKSIFFNLPYWKTNLLHHCLDVMHIKKNIYKLLLEMILNIKDKIKDDLNSLFDLQEWGSKRSLHPKLVGENSGGSFMHAML